MDFIIEVEWAPSLIFQLQLPFQVDLVSLQLLILHLRTMPPKLNGHWDTLITLCSQVLFLILRNLIIFFFMLTRVSRALQRPYCSLGVCSPPMAPSHIHQIIIGRSPLRVAPRYWLEVSNQGSHGSHEALGTTRPTPWGCTELKRKEEKRYLCTR